MIHSEFIQNGTSIEVKESDYYVINSLLNAKTMIVELFKRNMTRYLTDPWRKGIACLSQTKSETCGIAQTVARKFSDFLPQSLQTSREESALGDGFQYVTDLINPLTIEQLSEINSKN